MWQTIRSQRKPCEAHANSHRAIQLLLWPVYKHHMDKHAGIQYKCDYCSKVFALSRTRDYHMSVHSGFWCDKGFNNRTIYEKQSNAFLDTINRNQNCSKMPRVCSIVLIWAVLYRVGVNTCIVLLWRKSIKAGVNWHKIQEIEHTPGSRSSSNIWMYWHHGNHFSETIQHCIESGPASQMAGVCSIVPIFGDLEIFF